MKGKNLPNIFWAEAVVTSIHILNRCPTRSVQNITTYEAWCGRKPNISHLRVFGCFAYAHVPTKTRRKLDDKSVKCICMGYCEETKDYRLYNLETKRLIISHDVLFDEKEEWQWNHDVQKQPPSIVVQEDEFFVSTNPLSNQNTSEATSTPSSSATSSPVSSPIPPPKRTKYLNEIYGYTNFCLKSQIEVEPRCYKDAVAQVPRWSHTRTQASLCFQRT